MYSKSEKVDKKVQTVKSDQKLSENSKKCQILSKNTKNPQTLSKKSYICDLSITKQNMVGT